MDFTTSSVVVDTNIRCGTANVLAQKQFSRAMYSGAGNCVCQINLGPGKEIQDAQVYQFVSILTDVPLKVTFVSRQNEITTLVANKVLILDDYISDLVILNISEAETAQVSITKLN